MDLHALLKQGNGRQQAERVMRTVDRDAAHFKALMAIMLGSERVAGQRAAHAADLVAEKHPHLVLPHLGSMLDALDRDLHEGVHRTCIRIMQHCDLPRKWHGPITAAMFARIAERDRPVAQRAFAITVAMRMVLLYPELAPEFIALLEHALLPDPGPAVRTRARKALAQLKSDRAAQVGDV